MMLSDLLLTGFNAEINDTIPVLITDLNRAIQLNRVIHCIKVEKEQVLLSYIF